MEEILSYRFGLKHYARLFMAFFSALSVLVIVQFGYLFYKGTAESLFSLAVLLAFLHQLGYCALVALLLLVPYKALGALQPNLGFKVTAAILGLLLVLEAALTMYYMATFSALGESVKAYSLSAMVGIIWDSGTVHPLSFFLISLIVLTFYGGYRLTERYYDHASGTYPFTSVLLSLFIMSFFFDNKPISANKTKHLLVRLMEQQTAYGPDVVAEHIDAEYPLLKQENTPDVLGPHFRLTKEKPNLTFLVVEGLGAEFVGERAKYGGCMPFLDSLAKKSLHWNNFLSTSGRSFGAIPAIMGSLPPGNTGFMAEDGINRNSLFSILKKAGYYTGYYQGTNGSLDNLDNFLSEEGVDFVLDRGGFGDGYRLQPKDERGGSWGYPDKELFRKCNALVIPDDRPKMQTYTTISSHEPFKVPNRKKHEKAVFSWLKESRKKPGIAKIVQRNTDVFASLHYTDEALKEFFDHCKTKADFGNTLFLITGDHRLSGLPLDNALSIYHVPLLIYSPMLKRPMTFDELASHYDIAPTVLAFLRENYDVPTPNKVAWMGDGLRMDNDLTRKRELPLMRYKNRLTDYIKGDKLLSDDKLYQIDNGLQLKPVADSLSGALRKDFERFLVQNQYMLKNNKLIPPDLALAKPEKALFTDREKVYINSVFPGKDFDAAYKSAQKLAFSKKYKKAALVCRYVLSEVPGHIDAKILLGRIHAWQGLHQEAITILRESVKKFPSYKDAYAALLDVYFWSDQNEKAMGLYKIMRENGVKDSQLTKKLQRAYNKIRASYPQGEIASFLDLDAFGKYIKA